MPDPASPEKASKMARSRTGVPRLAITERDPGGGTNVYVQLSWLDSQGERRANAYSIEKWALRGALWNACAKLAMSDPTGRQQTLRDRFQAPQSVRVVTNKTALRPSVQENVLRPI